MIAVGGTGVEPVQHRHRRATGAPGAVPAPGAGATGGGRRVSGFVLVVLVALLLAGRWPARAHAEPMGGAPLTTARELIDVGVLFHQRGDYLLAISFFLWSLDVAETAQGHTYVGGSLSHLGFLHAAIVECETAIRLDPHFGNPYNDIGVYLMQVGRAGEAAPYFARAKQARDYCCPSYPYFNMGRLYAMQGDLGSAADEFAQALEIEPRFLPALEALIVIRRALTERRGTPPLPADAL